MKDLLVDTWDNWSIVLTTSELESLSARAPHGTHARYNAHLLAGEEPCDPCRAAEAAYRAELRGGRSRSSSRNDRVRVSVFEGEAAERVLAELGPDDDGEDERAWADDLESVEDETDAAEHSYAGWELAAEQARNLFGVRMPRPATAPTNTRSQPARSHTRAQASAPVSGTGSNGRLRAITATLDETRPRGRRAVELLVAAAPLLRGGVTVLRQYAATRECDPDDVTAAERAIAGASRQRRR